MVPVSPYDYSSRAPRTDTSSLSECIRCTLINARSICNKLPQLRNVICSGEFNVKCITETWLTENIMDGLLNPDNCCRIIRLIAVIVKEVVCV